MPIIIGPGLGMGCSCYLVWIFIRKHLTTLRTVQHEVRDPNLVRLVWLKDAEGNPLIKSGDPGLVATQQSNNQEIRDNDVVSMLCIVSELCSLFL